MAKAPAKAAKGAEEAPAGAGKSKKKLIIIIAAALVVLGAGGGGAAFFLMKKGGKKEAEHKEEVAKPKVFVNLDPFTVNLQSTDGDKYLQLTMSLEVEGDETAAAIKNNMPQVKSRIILLLSSKQADDVLSQEGKDKLVEEIIEKVSDPFVPKGDHQKVTGVYFTSFVVQ